MHSYHANLRSPGPSVIRVAKHLDEGEHGVPEDKFRERFARNPALIRQAVPQSDKAFVHDNSALNISPALIIEPTAGKLVRVSDQVPTWARDVHVKDLEPFSASHLDPAAASYADAKVVARKLCRCNRRGQVGG